MSDWGRRSPSRDGSADERVLYAVTEALRNLQRRIEKMARTLDEVLDQVRAANNRQDSLIELTRGIKSRLDAVLAGGLTAEQQAKVDAAITENTPPA